MKTDLTTQRSKAFLLWQVPYIVFFVGIFVDPGFRTILWTSALLMAGVACSVNAFRCGRLHCYFTGPFYILMALLSLLHGIGILHLGLNGWIWIGSIVVIVSPILARLPERVWGKYIREK